MWSNTTLSDFTATATETSSHKFSFLKYGKFGPSSGTKRMWNTQMKTTLRTQLLFTSRFPGLMSRCKIPAECRYFRPAKKNQSLSGRAHYAKSKGRETILESARCPCCTRGWGGLYAEPQHNGMASMLFNWQQSNIEQHSPKPLPTTPNWMAVFTLYSWQDRNRLSVVTAGWWEGNEEKQHLTLQSIEITS